jgi:hypothetical protein
MNILCLTFAKLVSYKNFFKSFPKPKYSFSLKVFELSQQRNYSITRNPDKKKRDSSKYEKNPFDQGMLDELRKNRKDNDFGDDNI